MVKHALLLSLFLIFLVMGTAAHAADNESVYERVMRTGKIRCGYVIYPPNTIKDPNTGEIYGMSPDVIKKAAEGLGLEIEWAEEVGTATMVQGLINDRYDMLCTAAWLNLPRARYAAFSKPIYYTVVNAVSREGDIRFDNNLKAINDPAVTVGSVDGSAYTVIAQTQFPNAKISSYPDLTDLAQPLVDVMTGKADVAFMENYILNSFMENNPGKVRMVPADRPVKVFQNSYLMKGGEYRFNHMIDVALTHMLNNGEVDEIISLYEKWPGSFKRVAIPYEQE
ncbi:MAG: amino acid ABC transporter substrate-binding protein [Rhodospirillales bacterium]|nr:amino acid ABC transporter substrate-binding protein [Rhodospirillales bacterium]